MSTKIVSSLQSRHVWIQCIAIQFRRVSNHYRIRMVEQCLRDSTAFCRVTFPELQRGKRARRTEIQTREGIKAGKTENDSSRILPRRIQTRRGRHTREHTRIPREIRGIPNPITSWPDIVDDSRTDPSGFNHWETNTRNVHGPG